MFRYPINEVNPEVDLEPINLQTISLGSFPSLICQGSSFALDLESGYYYDLIATGSVNQMRHLIEGGRLAVGGDMKSDALTFEEMRLLAVEALDLPVEKAEKISAKVTGVTKYDVRGRSVMMGLEFGEDPGGTYGLFVDSMGATQTYHNRPVSEIQAFVNLMVNH